MQIRNIKKRQEKKASLILPALPASLPGTIPAFESSPSGSHPFTLSFWYTSSTLNSFSGTLPADPLPVFRYPSGTPTLAFRYPSGIQVLDFRYPSDIQIPAFRYPPGTPSLVFWHSSYRSIPRFPLPFRHYKPCFTARFFRLQTSFSGTLISTESLAFRQLFVQTYVTVMEQCISYIHEPVQQYLPAISSV